MGQTLFKLKHNRDIQLTDEEHLYFECIINPEYLDWRKGRSKNEVLQISKKQVDMPVQINEYLYLSDAKNAHQIEKLKERGVTHVLNVAGPSAKMSNGAEYAENNITALNIDAEDEEGYPMIKRHLKTCQSFVNKCKEVQNGKIVIHCHAGINRSGVIMAAIFMLDENKDILDVVKHLRLCRGNACLWNESFVQQLIKLAASEGLLGTKPNIGKDNISTTNPAAKRGNTKFSSEKLKALLG